MADTRILLSLLEEYSRSLRRHLVEVRSEFDQVTGRWHAFAEVYDGDAADQFKFGWSRTSDRFREYVERSEAIAATLDVRIDELREANRTDSSLRV